MQASLRLVLCLWIAGCGSSKTDAPGTGSTATQGSAGAAIAPPVANPPAVAVDAAVAVAPPVDAAAPDAAPAIEQNPRTSELCNQVLVKILACHKDKQFLEALREGVDAKRRAADKKHLAQIVKWHYEFCVDLPTAIEFGGFLDNWSIVSSVPSAVDSCGQLGTTLNSAGGLFGGDVAN